MNNKLKLKRSSAQINIAVISLALLSISSQSACSQIKQDENKTDSINKILSEIVADEKAPGMIAAIISDEGVTAIGSAGLRKVGSDVHITCNDLVHLGSCTKAMTSTMLATLVAEGKLRWDMKLI